MAGVESAASLFSPEDPSSDPFATLGMTVQTSSDNSLPVDNAFSFSNLPNPDSHLPDLFSGVEQPPPEGPNFYAQPEPNPNHSTDLGTRSAGQQGWYNGLDPSQGHQPLQTAEGRSLTTAERSGYPVYGPYAPSSSGYAAPATDNVPILQQTTYSTYPASSSSTGYLPPSRLAAPTYAPSAVQKSTSPSYPHTGGSQVEYSAQSTNLSMRQSSVTVPAPPPTAQAVNRPKLPNAYDPPFSTSSKSTKRGSRVGSSQHMYGYNSYEQSPSTAIPFAPVPPPQIDQRSSHIPPVPSGNSTQFTQTPKYTNGPATSYDITSSGNFDNATYSGSYWNTPWTSDTTRIDVSQGSNIPPTSESKSLSQEQSTDYPPDYNSYGTASLSLDHTQPRQSNLSASPKKPQFRDSSPADHFLQPSINSSRSGSPLQNVLYPPTQQDHSSPLNEPPIYDMDLNSSPLTEDMQESGGLDTYASAREYATAAVTHSPSTLGLSMRTSSPAPAHINEIRNPPVGLINPHIPDLETNKERAGSPSSLHGRQYIASNPYDPKAFVNGHRDRTNPSSGQSVVEVSVAKHPINSYEPLWTNRDRSASNGSLLSSTSSSQYSPHTHNQHGKPISRESEYMPRYSVSNGYEVNNLSSVPNDYPVPEGSLKPFNTPYAPSPSLLGANDPLGRTAARVPVVSFGFGGKFVTCFHGVDSLSTGFDVALSSRNSTAIRIHILKGIIPESALDSSAAIFPGPLFSDPGMQMTSLVRTGPASQTKTKKAQVVQYLSRRIEELALGLRYLSPDSLENGRAGGKIILMKMLRLIVEHDGRLTGNPELDAAVRVALVPRLEGTLENNSTLNSSFVVPLGSTPSLPSLSTDSPERVISTTSLHPSSLDQIQDFLIRGERRKAYHYALDNKLWAHAMVVSSSIDKESWKEVVNEFLKNELGVQGGSHSHSARNRDGLRVAYSLFSGQGAAAVQELVPQTQLSRATTYSQPNLTPRTPNLAAPVISPAIPTDTISKWPETVAMMLSYPLSQETSAALISLGDLLAANQLIEAAHVCYLLAPQTSPLGGFGHPAARIVLVGSRNPPSWPHFSKDPDPIIFSEIVEFALSLTPPSKGQDTFTGVIHLQAYRFIRAMALAELGDIQQANRYCDAITAAINRNYPSVTISLLEQLRGLTDRIAGVAQVDKSFWTGAKISKPSLDTIGEWLEGRFTKLVTGGSETEKTQEEKPAEPDSREFSGPFSHYSTISSTTPSARSSPQPSIANYNIYPPRSGSATIFSSPYAPLNIDRASSAMAHVSRKPSPGPRIASANASTATFSNSPFPFQSQGLHNGYSPSDDLVTPRPSLHSDDSEKTGREATWWGSSTYNESKSMQTPTGTTFIQVDQNAVTQSSDGFISLMDNASYSVVSAMTPTRNGPQVSPPHDEDEDDEDLGLGNNKPKPKPATEEQMEDKVSTPEPVTEAIKQPETELAPAVGSSWFSRWWKKSDTPGPIRASLGEESAFYYDKDLKRWVNKKAGAEAAKPNIPSAPPSRAQTASPGMTGPRPPGTPGSASPPTRPASAIDLSTSPPSRTVMRVRSSLAPPPESAPGIPAGQRLTQARPRSQASKRNVRSRYVNVLQESSS